jgi:hypothetical protein
MKAMLMIAATATALAGAMLLPANPAAAQRDPKVLIIYGNDRCPTSNGEEIVVCAHKPEGERYRIPEELREGAKNAPPRNWTDRATELQYVGKQGPASCSADNSGGWTGCWSKLMQQARAERKDDKKAEPELP